jgi:ribosome-associated protein
MPDKEPEDFEFEGPSKSELKRRMTALQQLGESLLELSDKQLSMIPIDDERLADAVREARNMRSHSARRRHLQLIGKLMRHVDPVPMQKALDAIHKQHSDANAAFHELEDMRDQLLEAGPNGVEDVVTRWPEADRQHLRQLVLQHQREAKKNKAPSASRKLFTYLRELQENEA